MHFVKATTLLLAFLGSASSAQGQAAPVPIQGPIRHVQYGQSAVTKSTPRIIYANTTATGYMLCCLNPSDQEIIDWGDITGSQDHDVVTALTLGYGTFGPTAAFRYRIYDNYIDSCPNPVPPTLLDISLTGLPGSSTGTAAGWLVSIDLRAVGSCFFLDEGPFGYSYSYLGDSQTGPLLAFGGSGNEPDFDVVDATFGCYRLGFGSTWLGSWLELVGHDGIDTFPGGCGGGLALQIAGPTCPGDTVSIEVSGASAGDWWAVAIGTSIGPAVGGMLGGCPVDVVPLVPIWVMGQLPTQPLTFPATIQLASGLAVGLQVITKNPTSGAWDSSNTEIINVP